MKFWLQVITILVTLILVSIWAKPVIANDTNSQTNTSGSNTNITGGYTATTTNNNDGQTNTTTSTTTNTSTTNGAGIPPMEAAGTPCPYQGKIGPQAAEMWEKYVELRPDYEEYLAKQKIVARIDEEIAEKERIEAEKIAAQEAEAARIEAERIEQELLTLKEENEVNDIEPVIDSVPVNVHGE
jgi:hypothetical protein